MGLAGSAVVNPPFRLPECGLESISASHRPTEALHYPFWFALLTESVPSRAILGILPRIRHVQV